MTSIEKAIVSATKCLQTRVRKDLILGSLVKDGFTTERARVMLRWAEMMVASKTNIYQFHK